MRRGCLIAILIPMALFGTPFGWIEYRLFRLKHADHARILAACRDAITNRASYAHEPSRWDTLLHEEGVRLNSPLPDNFPAAIRELHPQNVIIRSDYTMISFFTPFYRTGLIGFRPGAKQFGTFQYIDGLWFWDGNDSTKKKEYRKIEDLTKR